MKNSELLQMAKDWLEEHEWIQGGLVKDEKGKPYNHAEDIIILGHTCMGACALGALHWVRTLNNIWDEPSGYLKLAVESFVGYSMCSVVDYNDEQGRTKQHILKLYDRAIKLAKKDEE